MLNRKPFFIVMKDNRKKEFSITGPTLDDTYETNISKGDIACSTSFEKKEIIVESMVAQGYKIVSKISY